MAEQDQSKLPSARLDLNYGQDQDQDQSKRPSARVVIENNNNRDHRDHRDHRAIVISPNI